MTCKKCEKEIKENEACICAMEKKGFIKRGAAKLIGILKKQAGE